MVASSVSQEAARFQSQQSVTHGVPFKSGYLSLNELARLIHGLKNLEGEDICQLTINLLQLDKKNE